MDEFGSVLSLYLRIQLRRAVLGVVGGAAQDFTGATGSYPVTHAFIFNSLDHLGAKPVPKHPRAQQNQKQIRVGGWASRATGTNRISPPHLLTHIKHITTSPCNRDRP